MIPQIIANKTHIIYGLVILGLGIVAYRLFVRQPQTIIQTKTATQVVTEQKVVHDIVHDVKFITKKIETKKPDGTIITETDTIKDSKDTSSNSQTNVTSNTQIAEHVKLSFAPNYTLGVYYQQPIKTILQPAFDPANLQIVGGIRVFSLPVFLNVGTTFKLNSVIVGLTIEL